MLLQLRKVPHFVNVAGLPEDDWSITEENEEFDVSVGTGFKEEVMQRVWKEGKWIPQGEGGW